jgi:hypothetical protein
MTSFFNLRPFLVAVLAVGIFVVSPLSMPSYAQPLGSCFLRGPGLCTVIGGTLCAVGPSGASTGAGTCVTGGENASCSCFAPSYTLTATHFSQVVAPGQTATSQVSVTPGQGAGWLGMVQLSVVPPIGSGPGGCGTNAGLTCSWSPTSGIVSSTSQTPTPPPATLRVTPNAGTGNGQVTFTITAQDTSPNPGPSNGPQPVTLTIQDNGGGSIALLTFLGLLMLWRGASVRRWKVAFPP